MTVAFTKRTQTAILRAVLASANPTMQGLLKAIAEYKGKL